MKWPKLSTGTPVLVIWSDAFVASSYWGTIKDLSEIKEIYSYGVFMKQTKRYLTIAQSTGRGQPNEIDGYGGAFSIPIGTIRKITKL